MSVTERQKVLDQYATAANLQDRAILHERFSTNADWFGFVFEQIALPDKARILELGTGSGLFWQANAERIPPDWTLTLSDLSEGILAEAEQKLADKVAAEFRVFDAQAVPFADNSFDAVIANHMLYHVPDLHQALTEARRVLKPQGRLYAATNGDEHMLELEELLSDWLKAFGVTFERAARFSFRLENGADILAQHFNHVTRADLPGNSLRVTETEPLVSYALSLPQVQAALAKSENRSADMLADLKCKLELGPGRPFPITKSSGVFTAY